MDNTRTTFLADSNVEPLSTTVLAPTVQTSEATMASRCATTEIIEPEATLPNR